MKNTKIINMRNYAIVMMSLLLVFLSSCDKRVLCMRVHPHDKFIVNTTFTLNIDPSYTNTDALTTDEDLLSGKYVMRYTAEFWTVTDDGALDVLYESVQFNGNTYTGEVISDVSDPILLPALDMKMLIWADPIDATGDVSSAFDVESLLAVKLNEVGNTKGKDGFTLCADLDFLQYTYDINGIDVDVSLELSRAFGRHQLIANDLAMYLEDNDTIPTSMEITYQFYIATQYNCFSQSLQNAVLGQSYTYNPVVLSEQYLLIAEDYLFMSPSSASSSYDYYISPATYDSEGSYIETLGTIVVPNTLNTTEVVYGAYLTDQSNAKPGIDDSFDGEIVVYPED